LEPLEHELYQPFGAGTQPTETARINLRQGKEVLSAIEGRAPKESLGFRTKLNECARPIRDRDQLHSATDVVADRHRTESKLSRPRHELWQDPRPLAFRCGRIDIAIPHESKIRVLPDEPIRGNLGEAPK
jgi:hypothetical protein